MAQAVQHAVRTGIATNGRRSDALKQVDGQLTKVRGNTLIPIDVIRRGDRKHMARRSRAGARPHHVYPCEGKQGMHHHGLTGQHLILLGAIRLPWVACV